MHNTERPVDNATTLIEGLGDSCLREQRRCSILGDDCSTWPSNVSPLMFAEAICPVSTARQITTHQNDPSLKGRNHLAWAYTELGLSVQGRDSSLAGTSFDRAEKLFDELAHQQPLHSAQRIRLQTSRDFLPVFRMRSLMHPNDETAIPLAREVVSGAISDTLRAMKQYKGDNPERGNLSGYLGELGVSGLILSGNRLAYPSSSREGDGRSVGYSNYHHDLYTMQDKIKIPLEVKFKKPPPRKSYDTNKVLVVNYTRLCFRAVQQTEGASEIKQYQRSVSSAMRVSQYLVDYLMHKPPTDKADCAAITTAATLLQSDIHDWQNADPLRRSSIRR